MTRTGGGPPVQKYICYDPLTAIIFKGFQLTHN